MSKRQMLKVQVSLLGLWQGFWTWVSIQRLLAEPRWCHMCHGIVSDDFEEYIDDDLVCEDCWLEFSRGGN